MRYVVFLLIFGFIIYRYNLLKPHFQDGQKIKVTQKVTREPSVYENSQVITLSGLKISLPLFPRIYYGDRVSAVGIVDGKKLKDAKLLKVTSVGKGIYSIRKRILNFYKQSLPVNEAALVSGVVLGSKEGIGENFWQALKKSGTLHVVVASGMNVALVGGFLTSMFLTIFSRKYAVLASISGIWLYSLISGFDAPIVRAAAMGSIGFGGQALGMKKIAWKAFFITILGMLMISPLFIEDLGFILSSTATASLMLFEGKVNRMIQFVPSIFREGLSTSLAAQVGVLPVLYYYFGEYNLLSPFINALVLWTVGPLTIIGMIAGAFSLVSFFLGRIILFAAYPLSLIFVFVVNLFG